MTAPAVVQHASNQAVFSSGTSGSVTVTLGSAASAGNALVACIGVTSATAAPAVASVKTGANAENWAKAAGESDATFGIDSEQWVDLNTAGGGTSVVVVASFGQTATATKQTIVQVDVFEVSNVLASAAVDKTSASPGNNDTASWSSGATAATTQASEIAFGHSLVLPDSGGTGTVTPPGSPWTNETTLHDSASVGGFGTFNAYSTAGYNVLSGTGTVTYSGTSSAAAFWVATVVTLKAVSAVTHPASAALSGTGTLTAGGHVTHHAAAALAGTGTLTGTPAVAIPASAVLSGAGLVTVSPDVTAPGDGSAALIGTGSLGVAGIVAWAPSAALSGTGTLGGQYTGIMQQGAALAGTGALSVSASPALKFTAGLFGAGFLSIPQVAGGLVNGVGGAGTPQALPGSSQVAVAPPGSSAWQWLGTLGQVTALTYSFTCPGGADKMTCTLMVPASYRTQMFNPGWQVKITRGGHDVWHGKLDEPQPSRQGWTLTAVGQGNRGTDFTAFYSPDDTWPAGEPDEIINRAIGRGLPWVNPGLNSSPYFSQFWLGQGTDPGSQSVTAFLNLICTRGGLVWYVNSQPGGIYAGDDLSVFPLPTVPNRLLVCTTPVARTLGGYVNSIIIRYQSAGDTAGGTPASYNVVSAVNQASVAAHGTLEAYLDLADASVMTSSQAQAVGFNILAAYEAAAYAGPFTASYGQLLNTGGAPIDPGTDQSGTRVRLILTDGGYGGEVVPGPIEFTVGSYSWDDFRQVATIGPYQELDQSLSSLLSVTNATMTPLTVAST